MVFIFFQLAFIFFIMIQKILVANRGEIALRIMQTCKTLGIQTVAVFSEADRHALHVAYANEAYCIGEAASAKSYLLGDKIIEVAKKAGADAIHPGYGFLSERASFAQQCQDAGIIYIGPSAKSIEMMGDKVSSRLLMKAANVPMAPGTTDAIADTKAAKTIADQIGYPVLVKASAGGGGKGMRIVHDAHDFENAMQMAQSEAKSAFGDDRVYIEKYIEEPRHIEFQILGDSHGNIVHLFERECSIQRRHQKVIEEAPSRFLSPELRSKMGQAAIQAAKACNYVGAGTVEFLMDKQQNFYFMEMNTRLQVEHPVTEWICGVDLVALQIHVAEGKTLPFTQAELQIHGHAIECRIYAENPQNNFLPDPGVLHKHRPPTGAYVRVDTGIREGQEVQIHYDPMISKLITWGKDRVAALQNMKRALQDYEIVGVETTIPFCQFVITHDAFTSGNFNTHFVQKHFQPEKLNLPDKNMDEWAAIIGVLYQQENASIAKATPTVVQTNGGWEQRKR